MLRHKQSGDVFEEPGGGGWVVTFDSVVLGSAFELVPDWHAGVSHGETWRKSILGRGNSK